MLVLRLASKSFPAHAEALAAFVLTFSARSSVPNVPMAYSLLPQQQRRYVLHIEPARSTHAHFNRFWGAIQVSLPLECH
jgi:hypothetical protein